MLDFVELLILGFLYADSLFLNADFFSLHADSLILCADFLSLHADSLILCADFLTLHADSSLLCADFFPLHADSLLLCADFLRLHADSLLLYADFLTLSADSSFQSARPPAWIHQHHSSATSPPIPLLIETYIHICIPGEKKQKRSKKRFCLSIYSSSPLRNK